MCLEGLFDQLLNGLDLWDTLDHLIKCERCHKTQPWKDHSLLFLLSAVLIASPSSILGGEKKKKVRHRHRGKEGVQLQSQERKLRAGPVGSLVLENTNQQDLRHMMILPAKSTRPGSPSPPNHIRRGHKWWGQIVKTGRCIIWPGTGHRCPGPGIRTGKGAEVMHIEPVQWVSFCLPTMFCKLL